MNKTLEDAGSNHEFVEHRADDHIMVNPEFRDGRNIDGNHACRTGRRQSINGPALRGLLHST